MAIMRLENINQRLKYRFLEALAAGYNMLLAPRDRHSRVAGKSGLLNEIESHSRRQSDISDHLIPLFIEAAAMRPSLLVELGVRSGESTVALGRVADIFGANLISVDLEDCSAACSSSHQVFVKSDDIRFAQQFGAWCGSHGLVQSIDVLFIDTSHEFDHTVAEIENWFPILSPHCKVVFHDTNMSTVYFRKNGTIGIGWANQRGVIAAIEQYFNCRFDERQDFVHFTQGWIIKHFANCNGLTILERVGLREHSASPVLSGAMASLVEYK
jgi:hypothetical protein